MPPEIEQIQLSDYDYDLPEERIAKFPVSPRDCSKLLVYRQGGIEHSIFKDLGQYLPQKSLLFFNDTKVIQARIHLQRESGALIEIFLLSPFAPPEMNGMMQAQNSCTWKCLIGNKKKWKESEVLRQKLFLRDVELLLEVSWADRELSLVKFEWQAQGISFADILPLMGEIPLPPYLSRAAVPEDLQNYQTVYAQEAGAVAAPTAGLHFTPELLENLKKQGILEDFLTLHVSAGTFQPVKETQVSRHPMHNEQIGFSLQNIQNLLQHQEKVMAVGTTAMRALESLYWYGCKIILEGKEAREVPFKIDKLYPYASNKPISAKKSLEVILEYMQNRRMSRIWGQTEIFILPTYSFKLCRGLITNFHLPKSTLILLVSAFIGNDWRRIYEEALAQNYRFLSYGDSSLLLPQRIDYA